MQQRDGVDFFEVPMTVASVCTDGQGESRDDHLLGMLDFICVAVRQLEQERAKPLGRDSDRVSSSFRAPFSRSFAGNGPTAGTITRWVRIEIAIQPGVTMSYFLPEDRLPSKLREKAARKLEETLSESRPSAKSGQP